MDEEDLQEAEELRTLNTSSDFAGFGTEHDPMRETATIDIFRPLNETIGSKLLKKMGWREGQGVGPRVKRAANLGDVEDVRDEEHLFAPDDVRVISFARKTDHKGLDYEGQLPAARDTNIKPRGVSQLRINRDDSSDDDGVGPSLGRPGKTAPKIKRTGLGVGILNDDGSDDEDPYSLGPRISYNRVIGGDKRAKNQAKSHLNTANPLLKTKPTFISKKLASMKSVLRKCHDGRLPPDGFVLADQLDSLGTLTIQDDKYRPPEVPENWKSSRGKEDGAQAESVFLSTADAAKASNLTAKTRASLLGESQLPGKSVFDFLTPGARDRLAEASGRPNLPAAGNEPPPPGFEPSKAMPPSLGSLVPSLHRDTALQALNRGLGGWMPYAEDEKKRSRYRIYLEIQAGLRQTEGQDEMPPRADGMNQQDWSNELQEFARAAEVFKPISGLMASRFTTSTSSMPQGQNSDSGPMAEDSLIRKPNSKPEDPAESAAKLGMFGPMTRSVSNFHPSKLLCKRFNVPTPEHSSNPPPGSGGDKTSLDPGLDFAVAQIRSFTSAGIQHDELPKGTTTKENPKDDVVSPPTTAGPKQNASLAPTAVDPDRNEALEQTRPGDAVFRAIFGSDDEDD